VASVCSCHKRIRAILRLADKLNGENRKNCSSNCASTNDAEQARLVRSIIVRQSSIFHRIDLRFDESVLRDIMLQECVKRIAFLNRFGYTCLGERDRFSLHSRKSLKDISFSSAPGILHYIVCIFIYKILNNMLPLSLRNKIEIVEGESQRHTRQADDIVLGFRKTRNAQKSVFYEGKLFNPLPFEIRECDRLEVFKRELKDYIPIYNTICLVISIDSIISCIFAFCILFLYFIFYIIISCCFSYSAFCVLYLKID